MLSFSTLSVLVTHLGMVAGESVDPWCDDPQGAAAYLQRCQEDGTHPERQAPFGLTDEMQNLVELMPKMGISDEDVVQLVGMYSTVAYSAEDRGILALAQEVEGANGLYDYQSGEYIRPSSPSERWESAKAARQDGGGGVITVGGQTVFCQAA